jgi:hypothetical protein
MNPTNWKLQNLSKPATLMYLISDKGQSKRTDLTQISMGLSSSMTLSTRMEGEERKENGVVMTYYVVTSYCTPLAIEASNSCSSFNYNMSQVFLGCSRLYVLGSGLSEQGL